LARGDGRAAETHFRRAVAHDPESYVALNNLGLVLHRLGRVQEAIERFHEAARANPTAGEARENLIGAVRRFLQPNAAFLATGIAIGALARATSFQPVVFSVMLAGWVAGYLAWRKRRLQRLPLGAAAVYTCAGAWTRGPFTPTTRFAAAYRRLRPRR
jgi:tetratricopeptide (TPR) repeat protein